MRFCRQESGSMASEHSAMLKVTCPFCGRHGKLAGCLSLRLAGLLVHDAVKAGF